jgi:hypothetical protein
MLSILKIIRKNYNNHSIRILHIHKVIFLNLDTNFQLTQHTETHFLKEHGF